MVKHPGPDFSLGIIKINKTTSKMEGTKKNEDDPKNGDDIKNED